MKKRSKTNLHHKLEQLRKASWGVIIAGVCTLGMGAVAQAQTVITPISNNRYYIELKDVSLSDALELIFKAAGNPDHRIDEAAKHYFISSLTLTNVDWNDAILQLVNSKGFKLTRPNGKTYVINPPPVPKQQNPGMMPGMSGAPGMPPNPFGASLDGNSTVDTVASAQFGNRGGNRGGRTNNRTNPDGPPYGIENGTYQLLLVNHIYVGGIARLFELGVVVPTEELVYPESTLNSSSGSGGGIGGSGGGGISGIGSGGGGFGGGGGGLGGGGGGLGGGGGFGGGGGISNISDRNLKENFAPIDSQDILAKINKMPISTWNYKFDDTAVRHLGPMAQDFAAAFGVGHDDRHISTIDEGGVSLAGIQALYRLVQKQSKEIEALQQQINELKSNANTSDSPVITPGAKLPVAP